MTIASILSTIDWIGIIKILIPLYIVKFYYSYYTRKSPLPGPFPLPLIGTFHQVGLNPAKYAIEHKEYGDMFEIWIGHNRSIILSNPSLIDEIYIPTTKNNKFFSRIPIAYFNGKGLIFNNDIPSWKRGRKFVMKSLTAPRFLKDFTNIAQTLFNENESFWDKNEYEIDFAIWVKCFTTDIALKTITRKRSYCLNTYLFGEDNSDPVKSEEIKRTVKYKEAAKYFLATATFQAFTPEVLIKYVPGFYHLNKRYEKNTEWLTQTMLDVISQRREEIDNMPSDEKVDSSLLDILLTLNTVRDPNEYDESETPLTDQEICSIITEVCIAAIDSTGNTFCYTIWLLARHPKVLARFQKEINEILGDDISRPITYEDLDKFTYLDAIIKESARVFTIIPFTIRNSTEEGVIGGYHWDANTCFYVNHEKVHKSPEIWKDPEEFIPERFLKESGNEMVKNSYLPFGGGARTCPGRHMATAELKTLLILLYRKYDVELVDKVSDKPKIQYAAVYICTDLKVIVRPKKGVNV